MRFSCRTHRLAKLVTLHRNLGKRITKSVKIYFLDVGLASYLTGVQTERHLLQGPLAGPLFENFVVQEIVKFYYRHGKTGMAKPIEQFMKLFSGLNIHPGLIVSLSDETIPITSKVTSLSLDSLLERLQAII